MKNLFKITEEEKKQILKKYNILKEANDIGCIDGIVKTEVVHTLTKSQANGVI